MKLLKIIIGLAISAVCLFFALQGIHWSRVVTVIAAANFFLLIPAILLHFLSFYIRAAKWSLITSKYTKTKANLLFPLVSIGLAMNNILPLRAGEIGRVVLLSNTHKISKIDSAITIIVERLFDIIGLLIILTIFLRLHTWPEYAANYINTATVFLCLCIVGLPLAIYLSDYLLTLPLLRRFKDLKAIRQVKNGYKAYNKDYRLLLKVTLLSLLLWSVEGLGYYVMAQMFALHISLTNILFICALVNMSAIIPSTAGFIGTFELFATTLLVFTGISKALALGYVLILHLELILPITVVGVFLYFSGKYYNYLTFRTLEEEQ